jgi:hypothetical protein
MRNEKVPDNRLKRLTMRCDVRGIYGGNDDAGGDFFRCIAAITADDSDDGCTRFFRQLNGAYQIRTDLLFQVASTHGKNQQAVFGIEP